MQLNFQKKYLIPTLSALIALIFSVTALDIYQSYSDLHNSKKQEAITLINAVEKAGELNYRSNFEIQDEIVKRLLNNALFLSQNESKIGITTRNLIDICKKNDIDHIYIFDNPNKLKISDSDNHYPNFRLSNEQKSMVDSLVNAKFDYFIADNVVDDNGKSNFLIFHKRDACPKGFIIITLEMDNFLKFRQKIGIGKFIQKITLDKDIVFCAIQDYDNIIAASSNIKSLKPIYTDTFLVNSIKFGTDKTRSYVFNKNEILETVKPFYYEGDFVGLIRIGISLENLHQMFTRILIRSSLLVAIIIALIFIAIAYLSAGEKIKEVSHEYSHYQSFTDIILENIDFCIIAFDLQGNLLYFNKCCNELNYFDKIPQINDSYRDLFMHQPEFIKILNSTENIDYFEVKHSGLNTYIAGSLNINKNTKYSKIIIFKDITAKKIEEENKNRIEKTTAMGELAASVAHEIRNPLNSIGITAQRLTKEFLPSEYQDEYKQLVNIIKTETKRVSEIITLFLDFARPPKPNKKVFNYNELFNDLYFLFKSTAEAQKIKFTLDVQDLDYCGDYNMLKQALINILKNAFEATNDNGTISIQSKITGSNYQITISDSGHGISEKIKNKIFDIYFTTKSNGNGLGLSIVNRIINNHNGNIHIETEENIGTRFVISLPI